MFTTCKARSTFWKPDYYKISLWAQSKYVNKFVYIMTSIVVTPWSKHAIVVCLYYHIGSSNDSLRPWDNNIGTNWII